MVYDRGTVEAIYGAKYNPCASHDHGINSRTNIRKQRVLLERGLETEGGGWVDTRLMARALSGF